MSMRLYKTEVGDMVVSTVKLPWPLPEGFAYSGRAMWYETMIFGGKRNGYTRRCETEEEAMKQHEYVVSYARQIIKGQYHG